VFRSASCRTQEVVRGRSWRAAFGAVARLAVCGIWLSCTKCYIGGNGGSCKLLKDFSEIVVTGVWGLRSYFRQTAENAVNRLNSVQD
jgi:hypothetical protein